MSKNYKFSKNEEKGSYELKEGDNIIAEIYSTQDFKIYIKSLLRRVIKNN